MAQRRHEIDKKTRATLSTGVQTKPRRKRPGNNNAETRYVGMKFRAARQPQRNLDDLDWQIRFAKMKLHHWHDADNWNWGALNVMLERAESERQRLT